jgi:hypothetical protein
MSDLPKLQTAEEQAQSGGLSAWMVALRWLEADRAKGEQLEQNCRSLFGALPDESQERLIWRGIIGFTNAATLDATTSPARVAGSLPPEEIKKFLMLLKLCDQSSLQDLDMDSFAEVQQFAKGLPTQFGLDAVPDDAGKAINIIAFTMLSNRYQPQLRRFLTWMCEPQKHPDLSTEAINFLAKHARGVDIRPGDSDANFDDSSADYNPVYYHKTVQYQSVMSPICKFIFDRIERYHDWLDRIPGKKVKRHRDNEDEIAREKAIPIRICDRPGCGRFLIPQRIGRKKFCSKKCLVAQPGRTGKENKDYMWLYRRETERRAVVRSKLKSPKNEQRLTRIEKDWPDLAGRVKKLRQRVG